MKRPDFLRASGLQRGITGLLVIICASVGYAQIAPPDGSALENFDVRDAKSDSAKGASVATIAAYRARQFTVGRAAATQAVADAMGPARADLARRVPALHFELNRFGHAPEIVGVTGAGTFLTPVPDGATPRETVARNYLVENAALYGLTADQAGRLVKFSDYANPAGNLSWIGFRQEISGLPVFQGEVLAAFTARGELARTTGNLAAAVDESALAATPALSPAQAASFAASAITKTVAAEMFTPRSAAAGQAARGTTLSPGPFAREIKTELVYFPIEPGVLTLAYSMVLWEKVYAYYILVDANDGTLLWRKCITAHQTQPATYNVYTDDSPAPLSPTNALPGSGLQGAGIARSNVTVIGNEPPNTFNNLGWITDGNNTTSGNNVDCGLDLVSPDGIDPGTEATGSPNRVFSFTYNPAPLGSDAPSDPNYQNGVVTNLFYWTNVYHDRLYLLGFTEAAGNFQNDNFSRGGAANDAVSAQAQDFSGTNNANFSTPPDGTPGKMQMYIFNRPTPFRDGSLDADIFLHELTHGTSERLHANGSGLATQPSGGMGEGWSDFYGRALLATASENVNGVYAAGAYSTLNFNAGFTDNYYYGIRRFPYAVKSNVGANGKPHNPLTFADIDAAKINLTDGAFPKGPVGSATASEVHNVGEVWCMMLLEMRARIITRLGFAAGNQRALQIVTDGMKLDPASPTFIQGRDAIIAADNAGFLGADVADIRIAFALRGAGLGATSTNPSGNNPIITVNETFEPYLYPGAITFTDTLGNGNGIAEPGEDLLLSVPINNVSTSGVAATASTGVYLADYGTIPAASAVTRTINYRVPAATACGALLTIPITINSPLASTVTNFVLRVGQPVASFAENFDSVVVPALPVGWTTATTGAANTVWATVTSPVVDAVNGAFAPDVTVVTDSNLDSVVIPITSAAAQISFKHNYDLESTFDGGVLEIKIGAGSFTDIITAGGSFVQGGYNAVISTGFSSPIGGRSAWSGTAAGVVTTVNLPPGAAGQAVQFRWRLGCDSSIARTGWTIDTVTVSDGFTCATIDTDGDGMPNGWEIANGFNPGFAGDAALDFDGDGQTNLQEYLAGTDPRAPGSVLRITSEVRNNVTGNVAVTFPSVNGLLYRVEWNTDIAAGTWNTLQDNVPGTGANVVVTDTTTLGQPKRFYRVKLLP